MNCASWLADDRLRDLVNSATATEPRVRLGSAIRLAFAAIVMLLGWTAFRAMCSAKNLARPIESSPPPARLQYSRTWG
jgi:hypothetical protein